MKKTKWFMAAVLMAAIVFTFGGSAEAKSKKYFDVYMVEDEGSYAPISSYDWSETPWVYIHMPKEDDYRLKISWWYGLDPTLIIYGSDQDVWVSLEGGWDGNQWKEWEDIKESGIWSVSADYKYLENCNSRFGKGHDLVRFEVNQPVAPEPVSSMLFIIGGATLGIARFRRK